MTITTKLLSVAEILTRQARGLTSFYSQDDVGHIRSLMKTLNAQTGLEHDDDSLGKFALQAARLAREIGKERRVAYDQQHAHPLEILETLAPYIEFSPDMKPAARLERMEKIIATAIIYPMLRPRPLEPGAIPGQSQAKEESSYFDRVDQAFKDIPSIGQLIRNVLRFRDVNWMARIAGYTQNVPHSFWGGGNG